MPGFARHYAFCAVGNLSPLVPSPVGWPPSMLRDGRTV